MLKFPATYKDLLQAGLFSDYSMGYTNHNGFRSSFCYPYKWYSLDIESVSSLTIHPFCITENILLAGETNSKKTLVELANPVVNEVKKYNGQLISIFHNDSFDEHVKQFYLEFLELVKRLKSVQIKVHVFHYGRNTRKNHLNPNTNYYKTHYFREEVKPA